MTNLLREAALFISGIDRSSPGAPSDFFDRLISEYRLIWGYRLVGEPLLNQVPGTIRNR